MEQPNGEPQKILLKNLEKEYYRLQFLVDEGNEHLKREMEVSVKAGELVGIIYDKLLEQYKPLLSADAENTRQKAEIEAEVLRSLNILCVRLVFCLYAEDAGLFASHSAFHDYLAHYDARDIRRALIDLFEVLDTPVKQRDVFLDATLAAFPYVNGGLFTRRAIARYGSTSDHDIIIPQFTEELKQLLLEKASADFDWSEISPTIFGAVFESTLNPETRRSGGMHYTSIENIHKVIDPLFMNDLRAEFEGIMRTSMSAQKRYKLQEFQDKLASLTFFDPACGSGNFLTETFLSLRRLENEVIKAIYGDTRQFDFGGTIKVNISQFYGIEINDFACTVAKTALWIAESQTLQETSSIIGVDLNFLPLKTNAYIHEGNALRMDWATLFCRQPYMADIPNYPDYIIGNPPFVGYSLQSKEQKEDILNIYRDEKGRPYKTAGKIDYVAGWYWKAAELMAAWSASVPTRGNRTQGNSPSKLEGAGGVCQNNGGRVSKPIRAALVSTNSITQGEQVAAIWQPLFERFGIQIDFAWRTFRWDSEADIKAQVHCVIIGFSTHTLPLTPPNLGGECSAQSDLKGECSAGQSQCTDYSETNVINSPSKLEGDKGGVCQSADADYKDTKGIAKGYNTDTGRAIARYGSTGEPKRIYLSDNQVIQATNINPYLIDAENVWIESRNKPLCDVPEMIYGSKPTDGGFLFLKEDEYKDVIAKEPDIQKYIKRIYGSEEFINNKVRYCLWLVGASPADIRKSPFLMERVNSVREYRLQSPKAATRESANTAWLFQEVRYSESDYIVIPRVSSERRRYVPMGFLTPDIMVNDAMQFIPNASLYHFGVLTSNVHMAWMRVVCGRLKSDYRYSKDIVYNNFPWPRQKSALPQNFANGEIKGGQPSSFSETQASCVSDAVRTNIERTAQAILDARAKYPDCSLADLYDETTMPPELRRAHQDNDRAVMQAYGFSPKMTESECVAELFRMYQKLTNNYGKQQ